MKIQIVGPRCWNYQTNGRSVVNVRGGFVSTVLDLAMRLATERAAMPVASHRNEARLGRRTGPIKRILSR